MADNRKQERREARKAEQYLADWKERKGDLSKAERQAERPQVQQARQTVQAQVDSQEARQRELKANARGVAMLDKPGFSIALNKEGQLASRDDAYYGKGERADVRAYNGITATRNDRERVNKFLSKNEGYSLTPGKGRTVVRSMAVEQKGQQFMGPGYNKGLGGLDVGPGMATINIYGPAAGKASGGAKPEKPSSGTEKGPKPQGGAGAAPPFDVGSYAPSQAAGDSSESGDHAGSGGDQPGSSGGSFQPGWYGEGHISDHLPTGGFAHAGGRAYEAQRERGDYTPKVYEAWSAAHRHGSGAQMTGAASTPSSYGAAVSAFQSQATPLEAANAASDRRFAASEEFQNDLIRRLTQAPFGAATV